VRDHEDGVAALAGKQRDRDALRVSRGVCGERARRCLAS
jgi:hypothetical protein